MSAEPMTDTETFPAVDDFVQSTNAKAFLALEEAGIDMREAMLALQFLLKRGWGITVPSSDQVPGFAVVCNPLSGSVTPVVSEKDTNFIYACESAAMAKIEHRSGGGERRRRLTNHDVLGLIRIIRALAQRLAAERASRARDAEP